MIINYKYNTHARIPMNKLKSVKLNSKPFFEEYNNTIIEKIPESKNSTNCICFYLMIFFYYSNVIFKKIFNFDNP